MRQRTLRNRWLLPAVAVAITTLAVQVLQGVLWPGFSPDAWERVTHSSSPLGALRGTPDLFWHIVSTDTATLAAADMPLLLLIIGNLVAWLVLWRREEMWLSLGSILGCARLQRHERHTFGVSVRDPGAALPGPVFRRPRGALRRPVTA